MVSTEYLVILCGIAAKSNQFWPSLNEYLQPTTDQLNIQKDSTK